MERENAGRRDAEGRDDVIQSVGQCCAAAESRGNLTSDEDVSVSVAMHSSCH